MNGIVRLKHIQDYNKVSYYSVCFDKEEEPIENQESLFENFIKINERDNKEKLNHILAWLLEIGEQYGALKCHFRHEQSNGEAMGLPPNQISKEPVYTENGETTSNNLRLYCHRLNNHVVFLFSGGIKTARTPQECRNVKSHFELANSLTKLIDNAFKERDILWTDEDTDIKYSEDLILYF